MGNRDQAIQIEIGRYRKLKGLPRSILVIFTSTGLLLCLNYIFHLLERGFALLDPAYFSGLMALFFPLAFLIFPTGKGDRRDSIPFYDWILAGLSMVGPLYLFLNAENILLRGWSISPPPLGIFLGILTWILVLEALRRSSGVVLTITVLFFSAYPLFAHYMPGILLAKKYSLARLIGFHFLGSESMLGLPTQVFGRIVIGFMVFAAGLQVAGGAQFFINFALSLLGHIRGGAAKVSILSSAMFATMSGSAISNVITTGSFTIPTMKRLGYPAYYAGAVEACASTGGVLTPPVMGITAFVMADFLRISYAEVCIAAAVPAFLYYVSLFAQSDFFAARTGLRGLPRNELPSFLLSLKQGWYYIFAILVLTYFLFLERVEARAPFYATLILFVLAMIRKETRLKLQTFTAFMESLGKTLCELIVIMAAVGMIIGSLAVTGVAQGFSSELIRLAGGNIILLLVLGATASFIMGMGMTMTACYIFLAMLLAPSLVQMGILPMAAHMFILYWGMISYITPPVALATYAAAGLAQADPVKTGLQAIKMGFVAMIVPFFFVYNPVLVAHGLWYEILQSIGTATVGITLLSAGFEGYMLWMGLINSLTRMIFSVAGILLFIPEWKTDLIGLALLGIGIIIHLAIKTRSEPESEGLTPISQEERAKSEKGPYNQG